MPKAPHILLMGTYQDNYLTLGTRTFHVPPEDIALAKADAEAMLAAVVPTPPDTMPSPDPDAKAGDEPPRKRGRAK